MAIIYSPTGSGILSVRYDIEGNITTTNTAISATTSSTMTDTFNNGSTGIGNTLNRYLYSTANEATYARIRSSVNEAVSEGVAAGIYRGTTTATSYDNFIATTGADSASWVTGTEYDESNGTLTVKINAALSKEEEEKLKKEQEKQERELRRERKKWEIKNNLLIKVKSRVPYASKKIPPNEQVAMETLRETITEREFQKYLKFGFLLVEGKGGKTFQVFRNGSHTKVWKGGHVIEEICVHLKGADIPPTDDVIAFRTMIQADEDAFRELGNIYKMRAA